MPDRISVFSYTLSITFIVHLGYTQISLSRVQQTAYYIQIWEFVCEDFPMFGLIIEVSL